MKNKLAIITGGSRGIGKAVALNLASQGYDIALIARNQTRLDQAKNEILAQYPVNVGTFSVDVSDHKNVTDTVEHIYKTHSRIDVLFNNAGIFRHGTSDITTDEFDALLNINLKGIYNLIHAVVPKLKEQQHGYIFNLASMAGKRGVPGAGAYALTKFGVVGYSDTLYRELLPFNVKVTALCPSVIATDMTQDFNIAQEDMISVDDIVKAVNFSLSLGDNACLPEICIRCKKVDMGENI